LEYQRLETQFMEQRRAKQAQMSKFLEENVDKALSLFHIQRLRLEAKIKQRHQVSVHSNRVYFYYIMNFCIDQVSNVSSFVILMKN